MIFNRLSVKIKTVVKGSNIRFITGSNSVFECEVLNENTEGEDLLQVLKCGVEVLNQYPDFENNQSFYKIEIPSGLVSDPETDIIVTPRYVTDLTAINCDCEFGTAAIGKSCNYYGQFIRNNICSSCEAGYLLDNNVCIFDMST